MWQSKHRLARGRRAAGWVALPPAMVLRFPAEAAKDLQDSIQGTVVLPGDADYHEARQAFVVNFQAFPQIIVYCEVPADVAAALAFARRWGLQPVCRAGAHSTAGYSINNGMVLDVSRISYVVVDPQAKRAVVGAGTTFARLNATLDSFGLHVPGGGCDDVAVAGYMQGGGYGFTSMLFGMQCDSMVAALVMLADGSLVEATPDRNADLFWALRGGGGGNFGVLLQVTFKLHELGTLWGFGLTWKLGRDAKGAKRVAEAMDILQRGFTGPGAPAGLGHQSTLNYVGKEPVLLLRGVYTGTAKAGRDILAPLLATKGVRKDIDRTGGYTELNDYLNDHPDVPLIAPHTRTLADARYVGRDLGCDGWRKLLTWFQGSPNQANFVGIEGYGGAIGALAPDATAFLHRKASFDVYIWIFWQDEEEKAASQAFLDGFREVMGTLGNGHAYQNYPNRENADYRSMFWGENFTRLLKVKGKYDPKGLFDYGQSITPVPADAGPEVTRPEGKPGPATSGKIERLMPAPD